MFLPFLDETRFSARLLGSIDLFCIWWMVSLAIGLGVLYKRRTAPIATTLLVVYAVIALVHRRGQVGLVRSVDDPEERPHRRRRRPRRRRRRRRQPLVQEATRASTVTTETIKTRDLEAIVSASGKIQPKRLVNISADTPGRVVNLAVNEGDRVTKGQFLLQIDPKSLRTRVDSGAASLQAAAGVARADAAGGRDGARRSSSRRSRHLKRQQDLWSAAADHARGAREGGERREGGRVGAAGAREDGRARRQPRIDAGARRRSRARSYDLSKVRIESPIDGIVTRRNIQEGETAVIGTMNNAGTVLLTLADMSVIQAEVEVDETNIPNVKLGQPAKITIDALPDRTFTGHVTRDRQQPDPGDDRRPTGTQATNFKVVVVLDEPVPDVRPGLHLHGRHHDRDAQRRRRPCRFRRWPCAS